jgi:hypothetical protein
MLKLCPSKRPASNASGLKRPALEPYYGKRPSGSAPFEIMHRIFDWSDDQTVKAEYYAAYVKDDGFQAVIDKTGIRVVIRTKNGVEYSRSKGKLAELDRLMRQRFAGVIHTTVTHPQAGEAIRLYAEVSCNTGDGDDLGALMHGQPNPTHLRVFDCDFAKNNIRVPLPDRLALLRKCIGTKHVIPTLLDTRRPVTKQQLDSLVECMVEKEGIIVEFRGRKLKHKVSLPLPLYLLGVGFTGMVPTHFVWGIPTTPGHFAVVLIDNKGYLCDSARKDEGKMHIDSTEFVGMTCTNETFVGKNYNALLAMVDTLVDATVYSTHVVQAAGSTYTVDKNRSFNFGMAAFRFLTVPVVGVMGGNRFWMTGNATGPGSVHIQAPQFLASKDYGHPIHRLLLPGYVDPEYPDTPVIPSLSASTLVMLASIQRNAHVHAGIVYGQNVKVDLVFGVRVEEDDYNTPEHSGDESWRQEFLDVPELEGEVSPDIQDHSDDEPSEDETEAEYRKKVWDYDAKRRAMREGRWLP